MDVLTLKEMDDREQAYLLLSRSYLDGTEESRKTIRDGWDFGVAWRYPDRHRLACSSGMTGTPEERILARLLLYNLFGLGPDYRDTLVDYAFVYHSCRLAAIDPDEIFERVARSSTEEVAESLRKFIGRPVELRSLKAFNLRIELDSNGEPVLSWS